MKLYIYIERERLLILIINIYFLIRVILFQRCSCDNCEPMPPAEECICSCEIGSVQLKKEESELKVACITEYEGFTGACQNVWLLRRAYFQYRRHYGSAAPVPVYQ